MQLAMKNNMVKNLNQNIKDQKTEADELEAQIRSLKQKEYKWKEEMQNKEFEIKEHKRQISVLQAKSEGRGSVEFLPNSKQGSLNQMMQRIS